jgi:protein-disulfide isomerase
VSDNRERLPNPSAVMPQIRAYLLNERSTARREAYLSELRTQAKVQVLLKAPARYRAVIDLAGAPSRGPERATVTIVEFSDFHCPYCRSVQPTLQQLLAKYPTEVRLVYKHYPIDNLHPQARRAAEAAWCAGQQQKFWQFHDVVYANPPDGSDRKLTEMATTAGLDLKAFGACLASGKGQAVVQAHIDEGTHYGVQGTPGFFVNGRFVSGAIPFAAFAEIIDEELAAAKTGN